ncbi:MAG: DegT/DnrJ/EryC1/StrS family aminotransferase [Candidatus Rokubacteria bacterium]|nr:DegT/DnrJ/EryC1/StrS family aminotransferase [Candidatus Rokubacteria bacterium]
MKRTRPAFERLGPLFARYDERRTYRFSRPSVRPGPAALRAMREVLQSGWVSNGEWVRRLEAHFTERFGVTHAIATANGTQGLVIAIRAAGLAGARIALPAFTWPSTLYALLLNHCTPVFADIDPESWHLDLRSVRARYDAVLAVDTFGSEARVKTKAPVIYDAADGYGLPHLGRRGRVEVVSLSFTKQPTAGEGGMLLTNDAAVAREAVELRRLSARMPEFNAILAARSIADYATNHLKRLQVIERYRKLLRVPRTEQAVPRATNHSVFAVTFESPAMRTRAERALAEHGFETKTYYNPLVRGLPVTDAVYARILALPVYPEMLGKVRQISTIVNRAALL